MTEIVSLIQLYKCLTIRAIIDPLVWHPFNFRWRKSNGTTLSVLLEIFFLQNMHITYMLTVKTLATPCVRTGSPYVFTKTQIQ